MPDTPQWPQEAPTREDLVAFTRTLPPEQARDVLASAHPAPQPSPEPPGLVRPNPVYVSFADFVARTTPAERVRWCARKAKKANRPRLMSDTPENRLSAADVLAVLEAAQGRCAHCESLAVEPRPSKANGAPAPWEPVGRRIGALGHIVARVHGGANTPANLVWTCLWCNTWPDQRVPGAADRGGLHLPAEPFVALNDDRAHLARTASHRRPGEPRVAYDGTRRGARTTGSAQ